MRESLLAAAVFVALSACPQPAPMQPVPTAPPPITRYTDDHSCGEACATLARLGCPEGDPSPGALHVSCVALCTTTEGKGIPFAWGGKDCVAVAPTVLEVRACGVACAVPRATP